MMMRMMMMMMMMMIERHPSFWRLMPKGGCTHYCSCERCVSLSIYLS
jgi:hypothetical protein